MKTKIKLAIIIVQVKPSLYSQKKIDCHIFFAVFKGDLLFAQAAVFFMAGLEPSSATMSFALYELAMQVYLLNNYFRKYMHKKLTFCPFSLKFRRDYVRKSKMFCRKLITASYLSISYKIWNI